LLRWFAWQGRDTGPVQMLNLDKFATSWVSLLANVVFRRGQVLQPVADDVLRTQPLMLAPMVPRRAAT